MVGAALIGAALGWQVLDELDIRECRRIRDAGDLLMLCGGGLDPWVLPLTLFAAIVLVGIGVWRLVPPPRY